MSSTIIVNHYNIQPTFDIYADVDQRDLGSVADEIHKIVKNAEQASGRHLYRPARRSHHHGRIVLPPALGHRLRGHHCLPFDGCQFSKLARSVHYFDGVARRFFRYSLDAVLTHTTFSVPSLMGSIMTIGVATANSILVVVFANDERADNKDQMAAALSAGYTRLRPVCMTALAMIIGMLPMALAFGEGGEQNAPLGRAVIGGLMVATVSTLFIVPIMYSVFRGKPPIDFDERIDKEYKGEMDAHGNPVEMPNNA